MKTIIYIPWLGVFSSNLTLLKFDRYAKALDLNDNSFEKKIKVEIRKFQFGILENLLTLFIYLFNNSNKIYLHKAWQTFHSIPFLANKFANAFFRCPCILK